MNEPADRGHRIDPARNRSRALRRASTEAERELWWHLRRTVPVEGTHFRRQVPIAPYIVDFACLKHRLIVEVDGGGHGREEQARADAARDADLARRGYRVLRFSNHQVFREIEGVLETIFAALSERAAVGPSPLRGGVGVGGDGGVASGKNTSPTGELDSCPPPPTPPPPTPPRKGEGRSVPPPRDLDVPVAPPER